MTLLESPLTVVKLLIAGFHPSDEDLSLGTPGAAMNGAQSFGR